MCVQLVYPALPLVEPLVKMWLPTKIKTVKFNRFERLSNVLWYCVRFCAFGVVFRRDIAERPPEFGWLHSMYYVVFVLFSYSMCNVYDEVNHVRIVNSATARSHTTKPDRIAYVR